MFYSLPAASMLRPLPKELVACPGEAHMKWMKSVFATLGVLLLGGLGGTAAPARALADEPLAGVTVTLEQEEGRQLVGRSVTGPDGRARFYAPSGSYRVTVSHADRALEQAAAKRLKAAPAAGPAAGPAVSITVHMSGTGTFREGRFVVGALSEGMETMTFQTKVSGPIAVSVRLHDD